jgi:hypothetical protein
VNGRGFRADVVIKGLFPAQNSSDNGERARSLLCGREALARPSGMAENIQGVRFNVSDQRAVMIGIRKGHPCGAAMYTSLTCLGHAAVNQGEDRL